MTTVKFFPEISDFLEKFDSFLWGTPLISIILICGIYLTIRLRLIQVFQLPRALKLIKENSPDSDGDVSAFASLCTALSATIGTGNIIGVATAVSTGGPGALFWMLLSAFFGMAIKYSEGFLAVKYRHITNKGKCLGGPFYYIEKGLGRRAVPLARFFSFSCMYASLFGLGTFMQISGIISAANSFFDPSSIYTIGKSSVTVTTFIFSISVTVLSSFCILGGIKRISRVSEFLIPAVSVLYVGCAFLLIGFNIEKLPSALLIIVKSAFCPDAVFGSALGITFKQALSKGISRGVFSNEAGLGTAPIAAASAKTTHAVNQGLVSMSGTFFDTIIICSMTGISIVITNSCNYLDGCLDGAYITAKAFSEGLSIPMHAASFIIMLCLTVFAFTTIIGWNFYGESCLSYLYGESIQIKKLYRLIYISCIFLGAYLSPRLSWSIANIFNALMALPNLIAIFLLSPITIAETRIFLRKALKKRQS